MPIDDVNTTKDVEDSRVANALATPTSTTLVTPAPAPAAPKTPTKKKKKHGGFGLLKAALLMLRSGKEARKSILERQNSNASNASWKKLLGSVRPMHLPKTAAGSPPPPPPAAQSVVEEMIPPPGSPAASSTGTMSHYASASSLQDLDSHRSDDDDNDPDEVFDTIRGDELIDSKAEEFIAQFYKQILLQNSTTTGDHQHELPLGKLTIN